MPGLTYPSCFDPTEHIAREVNIAPIQIKHRFHFDECDAANLYRDGFWRWFGSAIRCECDCHVLEMTEEEIWKQELKVKLAGWGFLLVVVLMLTYAIVIHG